MKKSKIKNIQGSGKFKEFFIFEIEMHNSDIGKIYKKKNDSGLKIGDDVNYTISDKKTIKIVNPYNQQIDDAKKKKEELICKQSSLKCAIEFCNTTMTDPSVKNIIDTAEVFHLWVFKDEMPDVNDKMKF